MKMSGATVPLAAAISLMTVIPAWAQSKPAPNAGQTYTGQSVTAEIQGNTPATQPRPLATIGNVNVGIWAPVPLPYNAGNNRNLAANAIWGDGRRRHTPASERSDAAKGRRFQVEVNRILREKMLAEG